MRQITTTELEHMEVINLCDGCRLGYPTALEIDPDAGCVTALLIPRDGGLFSFRHNECYRIPWCRIECLGADAILVKLTAAELSTCLTKGKK